MAEYHRPLFSKMHYELIAEIIRTLPPDCRWEAGSTFASYLSKDNPAFEEQRFYNAIGIRR